MARNGAVRDVVGACDLGGASRRTVEDASRDRQPRPYFGSTTTASWLGDFETRNVRARRGEVVVHQGARASGLHIIQLGSCKSVLVGRNGLELVAGYHITGDVLGVQTVLGNAHEATIIALEDSAICVVSWQSMRAVTAKWQSARDSVWRLMTQEMARLRDANVMLGIMRAEQRLAWFLLDVADRYGDRGYSPSEFTLRMTREDIGSCLALTQETVSRLFRRFHREGLVHLQGHSVKLMDRPALRDLIDDNATHPDTVSK